MQGSAEDRTEDLPADSITVCHEVEEQGEEHGRHHGYTDAEDIFEALILQAGFGNFTGALLVEQECQTAV